MALVEGGNFGKYGEEASGSMWASVAFLGSMAEYAAKKTEPTMMMVKETLGYEVGKIRQRVNLQYIRPVRRWLR